MVEVMVMNSSGFFCRAVVIEVFLRVIIYILCPGNNEKSCGGGRHVLLFCGTRLQEAAVLSRADH